MSSQNLTQKSINFIQRLLGVNVDDHWHFRGTNNSYLFHDNFSAVPCIRQLVPGLFTIYLYSFPFFYVADKLTLVIYETTPNSQT